MRIGGSGIRCLSRAPSVGMKIAPASLALARLADLAIEGSGEAREAGDVRARLGGDHVRSREAEGGDRIPRRHEVGSVHHQVTF